MVSGILNILLTFRVVCICRDSFVTCRQLLMITRFRCGTLEMLGGGGGGGEVAIKIKHTKKMIKGKIV